jgi:hypothetical protein
MVRAICSTCGKDVRDIGRHTRNVHGPDGTNPKSIAELNESDNLPEGQERWIECDFCHNPFLGIGTHYSKCIARLQAMAVANVQAAGAVGIEEQGNHEEEGAAVGHQNNQVEQNVDPGADGAAENEGQEHPGNPVDPAIAIEEARERELGHLPELVHTFMQGFYDITPAQVEVMREILIVLFKQTMEDDITREVKAVAAMRILPGLLEYSKLNNKQILKPLGLLRGFAAAPDKAAAILERGKVLKRDMKKSGTGNVRRNSCELLRSEIEGLFKDGRISAAMITTYRLEKLLKGEHIPLALTDAAIKEKMIPLFPRLEEGNELPDKNLDPPVENSMQVTAHDIRKKCEHISTNSCSGASGYTNRVLKKLGDQRHLPGYCADTPPSAFHVALTNFANKMFKGLFSERSRILLTSMRLVAIPNGEKLRPITIGCAINRLCDSTLRPILCGNVGPAMSRLQFAMGQPRGAEILARIMDNAFQEGKTIIQIDNINAFNNVKIKKAHKAVIERAPFATAYYRWYHEGGIHIYNSRGELVIIREEGECQGNPLAGDWYAIANHEKLEKIESVMREEEMWHDEDYANESAIKGSIGAFHDDIFIEADAAVTASMLQRIDDILIADGDKINRTKSAVIGQHVDEWGILPGEWQVKYEGTKVLGVYIGTDDFRKEKIDEKLESLKPPSALLKLRAQTQMSLISNCIAQKFKYTVSTARNISDVAEQAETFDRWMGEEVARIAEAQRTQVIGQIIQTPRRDGGIGITPTGGIEAENAIIISRAFHKDFISTHYPDKLQQAQNTTIHAEIVPGNLQNVVDLTGLDAQVLATLNARNAKNLLRAAKVKVNKALIEKLRTDLGAHEETMQHAAFLLSASGNPACTHFLTSTIQCDSLTYFPNQEFIMTLRHFFGLSGENNEPEYRVCMCGMSYRSKENRYHGDLCEKNQGLRSTLHNLILELLYRLLWSLNPQAGVNDIKQEQFVGDIVLPTASGVNSVQPVRADIIFRTGGRKIVIDIGSVNAVGAEFLKYPVESHKNRDAAALVYEHRKRNYYGRVSHFEGVPATIAATDVVPFIVETTGRLGPSALLFLHSVCGTQTKKRSDFISACGLLCSRYLGKMSVATQIRFDFALQNGG